MKNPCFARLMTACSSRPDPPRKLKFGPVPSMQWKPLKCTWPNPATRSHRRSLTIFSGIAVSSPGTKRSPDIAPDACFTKITLQGEINYILLLRIAVFLTKKITSTKLQITNKFEIPISNGNIFVSIKMVHRTRYIEGLINDFF